jgi:hypothetical protein
MTANHSIFHDEENWTSGKEGLPGSDLEHG